MRDRCPLPTPGLQSLLWHLTKYYTLYLFPFLFTLRMGLRPWITAVIRGGFNFTGHRRLIYANLKGRNSSFDLGSTWAICICLHFSSARLDSTKNIMYHETKRSDCTHTVENATLFQLCVFSLSTLRFWVLLHIFTVLRTKPVLTRLENRLHRMISWCSKKWTE